MTKRGRLNRIAHRRAKDREFGFYKNSGIVRHIGSDSVFSFKQRLRRHKRDGSCGFTPREKESRRYKEVKNAKR